MSLTTTTGSTRPWYCLDGLVDDYIEFAGTGGDLVLIKYIKAIQAFIANIGVVAIALFTLTEGGAPTVIGAAAITTLGLLNGALALDYAAITKAIVELNTDTTTSDDQDQ
jgi:hypothetical protein